MEIKGNISTTKTGTGIDTADSAGEGSTGRNMTLRWSEEKYWENAKNICRNIFKRHTMILFPF